MRSEVEYLISQFIKMNWSTVNELKVVNFQKEDGGQICSELGLILFLGLMVFLKPISFIFFDIFSLLVLNVLSPLKCLLNGKTICEKYVSQSTPASYFVILCRFM